MKELLAGLVGFASENSPGREGEVALVAGHPPVDRVVGGEPTSREQVEGQVRDILERARRNGPLGFMGGCIGGAKAPRHRALDGAFTVRSNSDDQ